MANTKRDVLRLRRRWDAAIGRPLRKFSAGSPNSADFSQLKQTDDFGANPGSLRMLSYAPKGLASGAPLVVVLHGCSQTAAGYDRHAGWTALADELGFAMLYPEQRAANNPGGCFNWFLTADAARGLGETRSIHEMVETMVKRHRLDRSRIFVTGLSAGGAMAAALLADYPELFSAGAVLAGLPCGAAASVRQALEAMSRPTERTAAELGDVVRSASAHKGLWPRISIWHGTADTTVAPKNADELVKQWVDVHGAAMADFREEFCDGHRRRVWSVDGRDVVESTMVAGMGHGAPVDGRRGERNGPFMLDAGVSSTRAIATFFGLDRRAPAGKAAAKTAARNIGAARPRPATPSAAETAASLPAPPSAATPSRGEADAAQTEDAQRRPRASGVRAAIARVLKAAGLMK